MALYTVQATSGRESDVADTILDNDDAVYAALAPAEMKGYVFVEAERHTTVVNAISDIPSAQKVLDGQTSMAEIHHFLSPGSDVDDIAQGDHVEITSGAYEGDTATIQTVNAAEEQVTVELDDAPVPIPIALRGDQVRVLDANAP